MKTTPELPLRPFYARPLPAAALIVLAVGAAYANTLRVPFFFDDIRGIVENGTLQKLSALWNFPGDGSTPDARPIVNFSLALNYAFGGLEVAGYHVVNLLIHAGVALTLFALLRRTFARPSLRPVAAGHADTLVLTITLVWAVHPLLTEAVTYTVQRAESLAALFYLLALYGVARAADEAASRRWAAFAIGMTFLGALTKEVVATAPLVALLYDRTFDAGSFREAWRRRRGLYLGLAASWIVGGALALHAGGRAGTVGFGHGAGAWSYLLTQCDALTRYLWLSLWPHPLVVDYGRDLAAGLHAVWPQALLIVSLLGATAWALVRRPVVGFCAASFFIILAPTSSVLPIVTQTIAERRMYLPLAALIALAVGATHTLLGPRVRGAWLAVAAAFLVATVHRNTDYRSSVAIWSDTVVHRPQNARAHRGLALALFDANQPDRALAEFQEALRLGPDDPDTHASFANALTQLGRPREALGHFEQALARRPDHAGFHTDYANALFAAGRIEEAFAHHQSALKLRPSDALLHYNYGTALARSGRRAEAIARFREATRLAPHLAMIHAVLGDLLVRAGDTAGAVAEFEQALRWQKPEDAKISLGGHGFESFVRYNYAVALLQSERRPEAIASFKRVAELEPQAAEIPMILGDLLAQAGNRAGARVQFEQAVRLNPADAMARVQLGRLLAAEGRHLEAEACFKEALRLQPDFAPAREALDLLSATPSASLP